MDRRPYPSNASNNRSSYFVNNNNSFSGTSSNLGPQTAGATRQMNNSLHSSLNPQATPYVGQNRQTNVNHPSYYNLSQISKAKADQHLNIAVPLQKLHSETRCGPTTGDQSASKKHKKDSVLHELEKKFSNCQEEVRHYERKRTRLIDDLNQVEAELRNCENSLNLHKNKLKSIGIDVQREKKRLEQLNDQQKVNGNIPIANNPTTINTHCSTTSNYTNSSNSNNSNQHSPSTQINNLSLTSNPTTLEIKNTNVNQQKHVQSTINNVVCNLLNKKRDVEFRKFDHIFNPIEEVYQPKLLDANTVGSKYEFVVSIKRILSKDEIEKSGLRYIIRGCIYSSQSIYQSDNLSFVKSYDFYPNEKSARKHSWDNSEATASKQLFPFDISNYSRIVDAKEKKLKLVININSKVVKNSRISFGVYLVQRLDYAQTLDLVKKHEIIRKKKSEITKNQVTMAFDSSSGVQMDSIKIALIDPLSKSKITWPCIGEQCEHVGTFDGLTFLESNSKKFPWFCPICGKTIGYDQLFYDELIKDILKKVSVDCTSIEFDKSSNWSPLSEESSNKKEIINNDDDNCICLD